MGNSLHRQGSLYTVIDEEVAQQELHQHQEAQGNLNDVVMQQQNPHPEFIDVQLWRLQVEAQFDEGPVTPPVELSA